MRPLCWLYSLLIVIAVGCTGKTFNKICIWMALINIKVVILLLIFLWPILKANFSWSSPSICFFTYNRWSISINISMHIYPTLTTFFVSSHIWLCFNIVWCGWYVRECLIMGIWRLCVVDCDAGMFVIPSWGRIEFVVISFYDFPCLVHG